MRLHVFTIFNTLNKISPCVIGITPIESWP